MQKVDLKKDVLLHGRVKFDENGHLLLDWTIVGFTLHFEGTKFEIDVISNKFEEFPIYCGLEIDGAPIFRVRMEKNDFKYEKELPQGEHFVTFRRITESIVDHTYDFTGVSVKGKILPPPKESDRKIEFIGDSIMNGYGVLGIANFSEFIPAEEDPSKSYAYRVAKNLKAEARYVTWSGVGMYCKYDKEVVHQVMEWYPRLLPWRGDEMYDFSSWRPDIIVIGEGTNDTNGEAPFDKLREKMLELLRFVRKNYPTQPILWIYGMMQTGYKKQINDILDEFNDPNLSRMNFDGLRREEIGNNEHPNVLGNDRYTVDVEKKLREITHWD